MIDFISNEHIDFKKWDRCIKKAFNGNIYAYSWYLNIVTQNWNALVENDYERVMPLPKSFFAGNEIIMQPKLAGQLGIFSTTTLNEYHISNFFNSIPGKYRYVSLKLNKHNQLQNTLRTADKKVNLDIDLIKPYENLRELYPEMLNELLSYSFKMNYRVVTKVPIDSISKFEQHVSPFYSYIYAENLITMQLIVGAAINNKMGQLCGLYDEQNQLLALAFFVWSHQKATMAFCLFRKKKLQLPALFFLIDDFIRNNSEKNLILHVELNANSKLVSLLEKIGAKKSGCFYYYKNQLPWYLKPFVV